jgi:hypothetical protein
MNGYNDAGRMTQRDFEYIGDEIEKKCGIIISATTIKRLSNGAFTRLPQIATLNALANYFNFKNWQEYQSSLSKPEADIAQKIESPEIKKKAKSRVSPKWGLLVFPVVVFGFFLYPHKSRI